MPRGAVAMWSGTAGNIPEGWRLCDGSHNTPDLRNRFVMGASDQHPANQPGGNATHSHNVTVNGHRLTAAQIPAHTHATSKAVLHLQPNNVREYAYCYKANLQGLAPMSLGIHDANYGEVVSKSVGGNQPHSHTASAVDVHN